MMMILAITATAQIAAAAVPTTVQYSTTDRHGCQYHQQQQQHNHHSGARHCFGANARISPTFAAISIITRGGAIRKGTTTSSNRGGNKIKNAKKNEKSKGVPNSKSLVESITVIKVLKTRRCNWYAVIRGLLLLFLPLSIWIVYNSIGEPFSHQIWNMLHATKMDEFGTRGNDSLTIQMPMPYDYYPSPGDLRMAKSIVSRTGELLVPQDMPSIQACIFAICNLLGWIILQFFCPLKWKLWLTTKQRLSDENLKKLLDNSSLQTKPLKNLAILLQVQQKNMATGKVVSQTLFRKLYPVQPTLGHPSKDTNTGSKKMKPQKRPPPSPLYTFYTASRNQRHWYCWNAQTGKVDTNAA